jgi:hypothetical protein
MIATVGCLVDAEALTAARGFMLDHFALAMASVGLRAFGIS